MDQPTTPAIPLMILVDALAALRAVKDAPSGEVPSYLWRQCMRASHQLESALYRVGLMVPVSVPAKAAAIPIDAVLTVSQQAAIEKAIAGEAA